MPADPPCQMPVTRARDRWAPLPGDPPALTRWLARQREQQAAFEPLPPLPPVPEEPGR